MRVRVGGARRPAAAGPGPTEPAGPRQPGPATARLAARRQRRAWHHHVRRVLARERPGAVAAGILGVIVVAAVGADWLTAYAPTAQDAAVRLQGPSPQHPFGTDQLGRDVLARALAGARLTLSAGLVVTLASVSVGTALGLVAGYAGGIVDGLIMRTQDLVLAFPGILLALALVAVMEPGFGTIVLALAIVHTPTAARVAYGGALAVRGREFVLAARSAGASGGRIVLRHVAPNCLAPLLVQATLSVVFVARTEATLAFLGLGVPPPNVSWGQMIENGVAFLRQAPWMTFFPGALLGLTLLSLNILGDYLRDALDPHAASDAAGS